MEMLSGSQIDSFLSATSLVWSSSIVLIMIGIVYFIKYRERHDSLKNSNFFLIYVLTVILNVFEYILNIVMQSNPSYELVIYKIYIAFGFFWNIAIVFYVINYVKTKKNSGFTISRIVNLALIIIAIILCIVLDIDVTLETNGKFYVLTGTLNDVYNISALVSNLILLIITFIFKKKMPKGFFALCILIFVIYISIFAFEYFTGYTMKESVFVYSLLLLVLFNTTSNQDKEIVNKLNMTKDALANINDKRSKLIGKISHELRQSVNDMVLYNYEIYLSKDKDRVLISNNSKEIESTTNDLVGYYDNVKDIFLIEADSKVPINGEYKLNILTNNIYNRILPLALSKKVNFNISVDEKTFLNYIGDANKIEKVVTNILYNAVNNTIEGGNVSLIISSSQNDFKSVILNITIANNGSLNNIDLASSTLNDFIESNNKYDQYSLRMVVSNRLLEILNSKINISTNSNNTTYSFSVMQGFRNNELYNSIN